MNGHLPEKRGPKPLPRLRHIEPGQFFTLRREESSHG